MAKGLKLVLRNGVYHAHGTFLGQRVRMTTKVPKGMKAEAEKVVEKIKRDIADGAIHGTAGSKKSMAECVDQYMRWRRMERRLDRNAERALERIRDYWGGTLAKDVTTGDIVEWVIDHMGGLKPGTVKRRLNDLGALLNHAKKLGWVKKVPEIKRPNSDDARDRHLEIEQIGRLFNDSEEQAEGVCLAILVDAGLRLNEAIRLRWDDDGKSDLTVRKKANGKARTRRVPISARLRRRLDWAKARGWKTPFCRPDGKPFRDRWDFRDFVGVWFKAWLEKNEIDDFTIHDLRHTFAFQAAHHGADLGDLMILMGHTNIQQTMRYRGFVKSRAKAAIDRFGCQTVGEAESKKNWQETDTRAVEVERSSTSTGA
jgi:integrase